MIDDIAQQREYVRCLHSDVEAAKDRWLQSPLVDRQEAFEEYEDLLGEYRGEAKHLREMIAYDPVEDFTRTNF